MRLLRRDGEDPAAAWREDPRLRRARRPRTTAGHQELLRLADHSAALCRRQLRRRLRHHPRDGGQWRARSPAGAASRRRSGCTMSTPTAVVVGVGAEQGLGAALCRRFAAEGYHGLVAGRPQAKLDTVVATIASKGGSAAAVPTDTTQEADIIRLFDLA